MPGRHELPVHLGLVCLCLFGLATAGALAHTPTTDPPTTDASTPDTLISNHTTDPHITTLYPNPVAYRDRGEYLVIHFPEPTNVTGWTVTDGKTTAHFPNDTLDGHLVVTTDPDGLPDWTDHPVVPLDGHLRLANAGDHVRLTNTTHTIDNLTYTNAPRGHLLHRTHDGWEFRPAGATNLPVKTITHARVTKFVLPDDPHTPIDTLDTAEDRILLAGYTFSSTRVTAALCHARERGVTVAVLVDGGPVGGMSTHQRHALDTLDACGVTVTAIGGDYARYVFHHAKYAVVDDTAIVMTENWKPQGTGGRSSRGWGVVVHDPAAADKLETVFREDTTWQDAIPWEQKRQTRDFFEYDRPTTTTYPAYYEPTTTHADRVDILLAPDNAEPEITRLLDNATHTILIQQVRISDPNKPFLQAAVRAAHRGVTVRILLSSMWYVRDENQFLADYLNHYATANDLPLEARLADPGGSFEKIHTKGIVIDDHQAVLGSINWNNNSVRNNREVVVVLHGEAPGEYYARVFMADWRGAAWDLPIGFVGATAGSVLGAAWYARRTLVFHPGNASDSD